MFVYVIFDRVTYHNINSKRVGVWPSNHITGQYCWGLAASTSYYCTSSTLNLIFSNCGKTKRSCLSGEYRFISNISCLPSVKLLTFVGVLLSVSDNGALQQRPGYTGFTLDAFPSHFMINPWGYLSSLAWGYALNVSFCIFVFFLFFFYYFFLFTLDLGRAGFFNVNYMRVWN